MKVKCIKNEIEAMFLTLNKIYIVIKETENHYQIILGDNRREYFPKSWFEIIEEKEGNKMKVRCVNNSGVDTLITINKIYDVLVKNDYDYLIEDDKQIKHTFLKNRFVIVEEKEGNEIKKYKTYEALKMIEENKKLKFTNGYVIMRFNNIFDTISFYDAKNENEAVSLLNININGEWKLIKQSVTFEEVLNSNKRCKIEHELLHEKLEYQPFDNLMYYLSNTYYENDFKQILIEGKWYLED